MGFTYLPANDLPLWLDADDTGLLASLSVSRAQGNKLYSLSEDAWVGLVALAGGFANDARRSVSPASPSPNPIRALDQAEVEAPASVEDLAARVMSHLREYGSATEAEVAHMAGGARGYRRLRRHLARLDLPLRFEAMPGGTLWRWVQHP